MFGNENPPPGTLITSGVTTKEFYDYFIVAQAVRQGTVTPTNYTVLADNSGLKAIHLQALTFKVQKKFLSKKKRGVFSLIISSSPTCTTTGPAPSVSPLPASTRTNLPSSSASRSTRIRTRP